MIATVIDLTGFDEARFWAKVDRSVGTEGCWLIPTNIGKYPPTWVAGRRTATHRVAYTLAVGPIPEDLEIDHLCRNPRCVNPAHLEAVTHGENVRRSPLVGHNPNSRKGPKPGAAHWLGRRTHCKNGHEFTDANTRRNERYSRVCRKCHQDRKRKYRVTVVAP